ncbi:type II toxin-antitoxin system RelE/ParE family toxin [Levilactobacillus acidifarinae]|uniref:type II toxin-antitoxin system RelE/ParE family toxin n=1 Tax=Levilactobacillus acidifarinae TaxID=267364 RepID=UPI0007095503|nr:type II toxin-antitoxin system RelE/ParE family toxin [Levilactobacillus acidifarinae]GEO70143.1 hypothetical protein LAC03_20530 [Levilactobacillus acidifarinae]
MKTLEFSYYDWPEFESYLDILSDKDAAKLVETIKKIEEYGLLIAERQKWVKKLDENLYEIRSKHASNIQRAIYFRFIESKYVITQGFTKKTQKTPMAEIKKARRRRTHYLKRGMNHHE